MARRAARIVRGMAAAGLAISALALAGCTIGPKYTKPAAAVPPAYKELGAPNLGGEWQPAQPGDGASRGQWWERFNDPQLNALEEKLNASNQNIAAAAASVETARALIREARAQYFPAVTANPAIANNRIALGFGKPLGIVFSTFSMPLEASWEPDLWGRVRNTVASNTFAAQAAAADLENVRLAAQAELAADYFELRAQDALKQVLDAAVSSYREALEINNVRFTAGVDSDEAVAQAETQLKTTQALDTTLGVLRAQYEHAIALLDGEPASTFSIPVSPSVVGPPTIPVGLPSQLLERRPDIAAAERAVAQANAQIGIARTAFFPSVVLGATGGFQSLSITQWLQWPSRVWSVGPSLAQTIFDAGLRRATVQQYQATYDQTVANYRETVLTAFRQVEDNLAALKVLAQTIGEQDSAIESARRSLEEAQVRYISGIDPYLNVIIAQTALLNSRQAAVNFRAQQVVASVQLIKALGGGWEASQIPSARELSSKIPGATGVKR